MARSGRGTGLKLSGTIALLAAIAIAATLALREELPPDTLDPPATLGMPLSTGHSDGRPPWLLLTEQAGRRHFWGFANGMRWGKPASEPFRHVDLWALDERLQVRWRRRLLADDQAFHRDDYRLAGLGGDRAEQIVVELGEPLAVSVHDGAPLDRLPSDWARAEWTGFDTRRLLARGRVVDSVWIGVFTDAEVAKLASADGRAQGWHQDAFGPPAADDGTYGLWTARLGPGGRADVDTLRRLAPEAIFRRAGLIADPEGVALGGDRGVVYVLAREDDGVLAVSRIDARDGVVSWRTPLAQVQLAQALAGEDSLMLYGHDAPAGTTAAALGRHGLLTALRDDDGTRTDRPVAGLRAE